MVALPSTYNPKEIEAATGGGSKIPSGKYRCVVIGSEEKPTKNNDGSFVELSYQILEGPFKNQFLVERFNFNNKNKQAVDIAFAQFKQLCEACGKPDVTDTDLLNNSIVVLTWGPQKTNPDYNEIKKREPGTASVEGYVAPPVTAQASTTSSPAKSADGKPSWAAK